MKNLFSLAVALVVSALLCVTNTYAQDKDINKDLASLKAELAQAVEVGKLTEKQAVQKYEAATAKQGGATKKSKAKNSEFVEKLQALVDEGKLTEKEAKELYRTVFPGNATKGAQPKKMSGKKTDYETESLKELQILSATLPTSSTPGDEEGPAASGFFGWAAKMTHRFMDNSHQGEPRLINGLSFRLDYRDHDSIGRSWENVTIRIGHGDWSSIKYNASREFELVDKPQVVFAKPWSFPPLKGFPSTEPAEWGGPQNALNFRFDEPFQYNGKDAIYVEFVFDGGKAVDGREWDRDLPYGFEYYLDSMPESGGWRVAENPEGLDRSAAIKMKQSKTFGPRVEAAVSYTAGGQSVWTSSPKGMSYLKWEFSPAKK